MPFKDREEAAHRLAEKLSKYREQNPLVLAIPRGGVVMARIIAEVLNGDLDLVLVHKLRAPDDPKLAIGAVDETGHVYLSPYAGDIAINEEYIRAEKATQVEVLRWRRALYTGERSPISRADRIVIVVDDSIATGASMGVALRSIRASNPAWLVAAAAVVSHEALRFIGPLADETVCLEVSELSDGILEAFFEKFDRVLDSDVIRLLQGPRGVNRSR